ncbi:MAG: hypothetical protein EKK54_06895 [Neisseriaceae bacterium]|nr:MAG: hypothetical protein EKK54_06895 [Neisseriaceae bacterium]
MPSKVRKYFTRNFKRSWRLDETGNAANELAVKIINQEVAINKQSANPEFCGPMKPAITYTKVKYCNNILEQDHRRKWESAVYSRAN